jgi:hypothetical protein
VNKKILYILFVGLLATSNAWCQSFFSPAASAIQYTGRIELSDPAHPRFWSPGVYIKIGFKGSNCSILLRDENLYGSYHNYIELVIDNEPPQRIKLKNVVDTLVIKPANKSLKHVVTIYKNTESGIGYLQFDGIYCAGLLPLPPKPSRKIEFIGNSITSAMGSDLSVVPCGKGEWYDQHNAYEGYASITARALNAQFHLSSVSGIGLIHSCCNMDITMPPVFDKINLRTDSIAWDFKRYQPDVVTICLGQNDGIQDSTAFCSAYVRFLQQLRKVYPKASFVCLTSPMGDAALTAVLKKYLSSVAAYCHKNGEPDVSTYFFSKRYHNGCGDHPDLEEHKQIAAELTAYLKTLNNW